LSRAGALFALVGFVKIFFFAFAADFFGAGAARFAVVFFFGVVRFLADFFCTGFGFLEALFFDVVDFFLVFFLVAMGAV
jgi:hypothetical protein